MSDHNNILPREEEDFTGIADLALSAYALLRLSPRSWRSIARRVTGPASRIHGLRNTRTRIWRHAIDSLDCHKCEAG